jgi:hypothetical protein
MVTCQFFLGFSQSGLVVQIPFKTAAKIQYHARYSDKRLKQITDAALHKQKEFEQPNITYQK